MCDDEREGSVVRFDDGYRRVGMSDPDPHAPMAHFFMVSPEYLGVMGMPILEGRGITAADDARGVPVLVVSETFAKRAFPGQHAVGRRLEWNDGTWEIVGVTVDVRRGTGRSAGRGRLRAAARSCAGTPGC